MDALDFIEQHGCEKVYNDHGWGGYLIWKGIPVYIDGRNDVYGEVFDDFLNLTKTEKAVGDAIAEKNAQTVLTETGGTKDLVLRDSSLWDEAYRDKYSVIYIRKR